MAPQLDIASNLPHECRSAIVGFLAGKDAANLRLASRAWREIAAEGLFNLFTGKYGYHEAASFSQANSS